MASNVTSVFRIMISALACSFSLCIFVYLHNCKW